VVKSKQFITQFISSGLQCTGDNLSCITWRLGISWKSKVCNEEVSEKQQCRNWNLLSRKEDGYVTEHLVDGQW